jgi:hypothetical protein
MYKNPNYKNAAEQRYLKYKPYIEAYLAQLDAAVERITPEMIRAYFADDPEVGHLVPGMTDGVLDNLLSRHGLEREAV